MKKAQAHLEIMMALLLFIGAIIALFVFINPFLQPATKISLVDGVKEIMTNNLSSEIGKLSIVITGDPSLEPCYDFDIDEYGDKFVEYAGQLIFTIYFSDSLLETNALHYRKNCHKDMYELASYSDGEMVIYEKIKDLKLNYENDYAGLKKSLGVSNDFSFSFMYLNRSVIDELSVVKETPVGLERNSRDIPIRVFDNTGKINEFIMNIRAW